MAKIPKYTDCMRAHSVAAIYVLSPSYLAAEYMPASREFAPVYFEHVGNTTVAFVVASKAAFAVSGAVRRPVVEDLINTNSAVVMESTVVGAGAMASLLVNSFSESILSVSDPKDLVFGVVGTAFGSYSVSQEKYDEQYGSGATL